MSPISVLEELNGNDSDHYFDPTATGRSADLAVQQRVGILPERRTWIGSGNYYHPGPHGPVLNRIARSLEGV